MFYKFQLLIWGFIVLLEKERGRKRERERVALRWISFSGEFI
jgi:hypothetical protein